MLDEPTAALDLAARYADQARLADGTLLVQDTPALTMTSHIVRTCLGSEVEVVQQAGKSPFALPA
ncbi:MAG: hypothetical protein WBD81_14290 [Collimonas pratensis]|uniref:hypothetical protein n=1 Tax=Collimonas pratensis TaxID=279113 RepID=UPI003C793078